MEKKCPYSEEDIFDYAKGEIEEAEKASIEEHLLSCSECKKLFEEDMLLIDTLNQFSDSQQAPDTLVPSAMKKIKQFKISKRILLIRKITAVCACLTVMFGIYFIVTGNPDSDNIVSDEIQSERAEVGKGELILDKNANEQENGNVYDGSDMLLSDIIDEACSSYCEASQSESNSYKDAVPDALSESVDEEEYSLWCQTKSGIYPFVRDFSIKKEQLLNAGYTEKEANILLSGTQEEWNNYLNDR